MPRFTVEPLVKKGVVKFRINGGAVVAISENLGSLAHVGEKKGISIDVGELRRAFVAQFLGSGQPFMIVVNRSAWPDMDFRFNGLSVDAVFFAYRDDGTVHSIHGSADDAERHFPKVECAPTPASRRWVRPAPLRCRY